MNETPANPDAFATQAATSRRCVEMAGKCFAWLIEVILFAFSLSVLLPVPASEVGMAWHPPSRRSLVASVAMFFVSLLIATVSRRETIFGLIVKTLIFGLFALMAVQIAEQMANSINNDIPDVLTK